MVSPSESLNNFPNFSTMFSDFIYTPAYSEKYKYTLGPPKFPELISALLRHECTCVWPISRQLDRVHGPQYAYAH